MRVLLPLGAPLPSSHPPPPRPALADEQLEMLANLIAHLNACSLPSTLAELRRQNGGGGLFSSYFRRASASSPSSATSSVSGSKASSLNGDATNGDVNRALDDVERCYWSREACLRSLRATKFSYTDALRRCEEIAVWRREFGVEALSAEMVSGEAETGKELVYGFDKQSRPVLYMRPNRQNTAPSARQIQFVVWCLERAIDLLPPTVDVVDSICLCIDMNQTSPTGESLPPAGISQSKKVLEILQTYYCERLGKAVCVNVPSVFYVFYKIIGPFVDPVTKEKIHFNEDANKLIPSDQLMKDSFGGAVDFQYEHETYFPALEKLCAAKKAANFARWVQYGEGRCGLSEAVIRGAVPA